MKDKEALKTIKAEITQLQDKVFGKEDKRQGITRNPEMTVLTRVFEMHRAMFRVVKQA
jgi:hypothetical protein